MAEQSEASARMQADMRRMEMQLEMQLKQMGEHKESTSPSQLEFKVDVPKIEHASSADAENSLWAFFGACDVLGLLQVAKGDKEGTAAQQKQLGRLVRRWTKEDKAISTSLRTQFGQDGGSGSEMTNHVINHFITPRVSQYADAEAELEAYSWNKLFSSSPEVMKAMMDDIINLLHRQPRQPETGDAYWVNYVRERMDYTFANALSWHMQTVPSDVQQLAATSLLTFAVEMSKAKTNELRRASRVQDKPISLFSTTSRDGTGNDTSRQSGT